MSTDYIKYLIYLCLVILLFCLFLIYTNRKKKTGKKSAAEDIKPITSGNISIFFDRGENVTILAYVTDLFGVGKASGTPIFLHATYSDERLGQVIRTAMSSCDKGVPCSDSTLMKLLGTTNWKEFSCDKRNVSVHFREGYGVILNSTTRKYDGAYQFNYRGAEKVLPQSVTNFELGRSLKEVLQKCRC